MPLEGQTGIRLAHPLTIVYHLNGRLSCISDDDGDFRGSCIEAVFYKFLNDRCRTLDDFARCNLVSYTIWQQMDDI